MKAQETVSPVDGSVYVTRKQATSAEIDATLAAAADAQREWREAPVEERAEVCRRMVGWILDRADVLGEELTWQMGRPVTQSPMELRRGFQERALQMAAIAPDALADVRPPPREGFERFIRREPLG